LTFAVDVNIVEENIDTVQKSTEVIIGLEVNPEKTECMLMSRCKKAGQKINIKIANRSSEDVEKFKYLGTTLTDHEFFSFPFPFVPLQRRGCLVASLFL
jgi:hypothetical protein